ncbi:MAG: zeta toxin family protein, partial [Pseudonocardia sp.]|nr:zeta toxin family protein [Pseudonocardia sp.]
QADIPARSQLAAISADNRRAVLGAMADRVVFGDEPNYDRARTLDDIVTDWATEDGHPKTDMRQGLAADTGRFRGAQVSDGSMFVVDRAGQITHAPSGLNLGRATYDLTQAHSLRLANLLERAVVDGEPLDWQDRQNPRAIAQLRKGIAPGDRSLIAPFRMLSALGDGATGDDWVRARQGDPAAIFDDRPLVESMPNPDAVSGAFAQLTAVSAYRPGAQGAKYPSRAQEPVARRVAKAARDAMGLLYVDPHRAAEIIAETIGRDGDQELDPVSVSGGNPGPRKVTDMLAPVLDQIGLSADGSRRTELSKLRGARFSGRVTPGAGAVVAMDDLVDAGPTAEAKREAGRVIADRVRKAILADGIELVGSGDGSTITGVRLPRSVDLGATNGWEGDTPDAYMIRQSNPSRTGTTGGRMSRATVEPDGTIKLTWRQPLAAGSSNSNAQASESIMRVTIPAGSWRMGDSANAPSADAPEELPTLSDQEYEAYTEKLEATLAKAVADGLATDRLHTREGILPNGKPGIVWTPARAAVHREIVDEVWEANFASVPSEGKSLFSGGLGGSGKGTVLKLLPGDVKANYATIDPDAFKEALAARGLVPAVEGMAPMEGASLIHEESSHLAGLIAARAMQERKNLIYDITMASEGSVTKKIAKLTEAGYAPPTVVFVDVPIETSVSRALSRHKNGLERYRNGIGHGGRYVPPAIIRSNATDREGYNSNNRVVFETLRSDLGAWALYDNSVAGRSPVLLEDSLGGGIGPDYSGPEGWARYQSDQLQDFIDNLDNDLATPLKLGTAERLGADGK